MPTFSIPINITPPIANTKLVVDVTYAPDTNQSVNIIIVNGDMINLVPYNYIGGGPNPPLEIVDITGTTVFVIFTDPAGAFVHDFDIANAHLFPFTRNMQAPMLLKYNALHNFYNDDGSDLNDDRNYMSAFATTSLNLVDSVTLKTNTVDLKLQAAYDASVNMIFTDDVNPMRIVNSRFSINETGTIATLIDRRAKKDANTYNNINFHQTELIPRSIIIPTLTFNGLIQGGVLPGGGYRYFFKYVNADGAETDIIEESRLVSVHDGDTTLNSVGTSLLPTTNSASFTLSALDQSFYGIVVYYTISLGEVDSIDKAAKILSPYIIQNDGTCNIVHTGYENISEVDISTLSLTYSVISRSSTLDVVNNRLAVGNTVATDIYDQDLAIAASAVITDDDSFPVLQSSTMDLSTSATKESNYSNPLFTYSNLGYWKGETYELGIVFITNDGVSPVYPLQGIDNIDNATDNPLEGYNTSLLGGLYRGYSAFGQNAMGIYRTQNRRDLWTVSGNTITFSGTKLTVDITGLKDVSPNINGFFFVRRTRKKDALVQGLLTTVAAIPIESKFGSEYEQSGFGNWCGVGVTSTPAGGNVKYVPAPGGMMPFGVEEVAGTALLFQPLLDDAGRDVTTVGVFAGNTVTLTSVDSVSAGDTIKFTGYCTGVVLSVNTGASQITLTGPPTAAPVTLTLCQISKKGSGTSTDFYIKAPIRDYEVLKSWAFYSPDTECAPAYYASIFSGNKIGVDCGKQSFTTAQVNVTAGHEAPLNIVTPIYHKITGTIGTYDPATALAGDKSAYARYIDTGATGVAPKNFSGSADRNTYLYWGYPVGSTGLTAANIITLIGAASNQFSPGNPVGKEIAYRPGNSLAYGRYVGLLLDGSASGEFGDLSMTPEPIVGDKNTYAFNSITSDNGGWLGNGTDPQLGYVATLYGSTSGVPLQPISWESRYVADEGTEYFAISQRYRAGDFFSAGTPIPGISMILDIYGGDCYLGLSWKQVWHPLGIAEAPQTNDINAYKTTRRSLGLLPYGYAIPVPAQSNFNFNVRSKERTDVREYQVYGTDRSFLPIRGKDVIRGNRQYETGAFNTGYSAQDRSAFKQFRLDLNAPFYKFQYPNRVYISAEAAENDFVNGFTDFKGLNFKDYNTDLGAITKLINLNNVLISVYTDGIAQIGIDERSLLSKDTGGIFTDAAQILSRANVLNSEYGSAHLHSVITSNNYVYGVDFNRKKIWRTNGQAVELISDFKIQNELASITKELSAIVEEDPTNRWIDVYSQFDNRKNELYFTFIARDPNDSEEGNLTRTLVYNETLTGVNAQGLWICETDDVRKFAFTTNTNRYSLPSFVGKYNNIYQYMIQTEANVDPNIDVFGEYNKFYDNIYDMAFEYYVTDEALTYGRRPHMLDKVAKIFNNISIIGNNSLPTKVQYTSETNTPTEQILKPYTNIRFPMVDINGLPIIVNATAGTQIIQIAQTIASLKATQDNLKYGDFISIEGADAHTKYNFVVIAYVPNSYIQVDKIIPTNLVNKRLYYGYGSNLPMRLTDAAMEETYGVITCQFNNRVGNGMTPTKLRGKWMRFKHTYEGTAPVYVSGILTDYGISLS